MKRRNEEKNQRVMKLENEFNASFEEVTKDSEETRFDQRALKMLDIFHEIKKHVITKVIDHCIDLGRDTLCEKWIGIGAKIIGNDKDFICKSLTYLEERGKFTKIGKLFDDCAEKCDDETICIKAIQWYEKIHEFDKARKLLEVKIKGKNVNLVWKIIFEGLMFEARVGSLNVALNGMNVLVNKKLTGTAIAPMLYEHALMYHKLLNENKCYELCEKGLSSFPKYIHLLILLIRTRSRITNLRINKIIKKNSLICSSVNSPRSPLTNVSFENEEQSGNSLEIINSYKRKKEIEEEVLENTIVEAIHEVVLEFKGDLQKIVNKHIGSLSADVQWKVYLEVALTACDYGWDDMAIEQFEICLKSSPLNTIWKSYVLMARHFMNKDINKSLKYLKEAQQLVGEKQVGIVLMEKAHIEEVIKDENNAVKKAYEIIEVIDDWKYSIEAIMILVRCNKVKQGYDICKSVVGQFPSTGRVWGLFVMLSQIEGIQKQEKSLELALRNAPKSGEVWCEGARMAMKQGNFYLSLLFLKYAQLFTPQYGDIYIEFLKLVILTKQWSMLKNIILSCVHSEPNYGLLWTFYKEEETSPIKILKNAFKNLRKSYQQNIFINPLDIYKRCKKYPQKTRVRMILGSELFKA
ncbi:Hypothetical protein EHI5A_052780 [Entamoeba histolytica KU27]|uniref:Uncharacterized protein n=2 Tax=Entamoeba histolytica TaxID=5759 RepID=M2Q1V6_ENTHI|nr:Hypothetical protein EHI5A_052780 [Entamoeba histolytica KU27]